MMLETSLLDTQPFTIEYQGKSWEVTQELVFSDFKDVEGVKIPYTTETESPMGGPMTIVTNKVIINGKVDESIFKKPAK